MSSSSPQVGVLGLGIIGSIWAQHLEADGLLVASWNRTPKPELPRSVTNPGEVASVASVVIICVADPVAVETVLTAILPKLGPDHLVIQSSTIDPTSARRFHDQVTARGAAYLEAPFTGSKPAAEARQLVYYLGGLAATVDRARPVLERLSRLQQHMGDLEQACAIKLAMNLQLALLTGALTESLTLAETLGVSRDAYFQALEGNAGRSGFSQLKEPKLKADDFSPQFSIKHLLKDVRLGLGAAPGLDLALGQAVRERLEAAADRGWSEEDMISLIKILSEKS